MYAPTTELVDAGGQRVAIDYLAAGRRLLSKVKGRIGETQVSRMGTRSEELSVTLVTAAGRRLTVAGSLRVWSKGKGEPYRWRMVKGLEVGDVVSVTSDGLLCSDRVVCTVQAENQHEMWITVQAHGGNLFAEEILCQAS